MSVMLVVADGATSRQLKEFFESRGHSTTVCTSSAQAQDQLGQISYSYVLVDLEADAQAIDLCRVIRDMPEGDRPYLIVLPASESVQAMRPALAAGADEYLPKPVELSALQLRLALGGRRLAARRQAEETLRFREQYFRSLLENSSDLITIIDAEGHILYQSASSENLLGHDADEMMGWNIVEHLHPDDRERFNEKLAQVRADAGSTVTAQCRIRHQTGEFRYFESLIKNLLDDPTVGGLVVTSRDIGEHRELKSELHRERTFFQHLLRNSPTGIVILDPDDRVVDANESFLALFGFELADIKRQPVNELIVPRELHEEAGNMSSSVLRGEPIEHETTRRRSDGSAVEVQVIGFPIQISERLIGSFGIYSDITQRKNAERKLYHHAYHDALTGLPNRALLSQRLERTLKRAQRQADFRFALVFIDLDRFKVINDSLGHEAGDELLVEMAKRLEACVRPGDTTARLGGDEFTIILEDLKDPADATRVADRILEKLSQPFPIAGQEISNSGSIGIAYSAPHYATPDELMRDADNAMYQAKAGGKARYVIFDAAMHTDAMERLELESQLRRAIENEELLLHYQPMVSLSTRRVVGFEALVRWRHPDPERDLISAAELIPICEETGLIVDLGRWVLREVCRQAVVWQTRFPQSDCLINVNLSAQEASHGKFLEVLDLLQEETQIKPASIGLEMNESFMAQADESARQTLWELRSRGYRLYIDAFGTGQSSLSALCRFPIDSVKVHRSFIHEMGSGGDSLEIVRAIATLGESLGLTVVAEGVETREQLVQIKKLGLPYAQGFFFSRPVPPEVAESLLRAGPIWMEEENAETADETLPKTEESSIASS